MLAAMKVIDKNGPPRESVCSMASSTGAGAAAVGTGEYSDDKIKISIDREVEIMKLIQHPNILQLYDVHESTDCM
jgi:serine/threonine protein kinase